MPMKLNETAYKQAQRLIKDGKTVVDERDDWSEHQPTTAQENKFIEDHGWREYAKWHLGADEEYGEETKERYSFPYGDFKRAHRCALWPPSHGRGSTSIQTSSARPTTCTR